MILKPKHTLLAGYVGYVTQAITINFAPLLFLTFENQYGISLTKISLLIAISFLTQLTCDLLLARIGDFLLYHHVDLFLHQLVDKTQTVVSCAHCSVFASRFHASYGSARGGARCHLDACARRQQRAAI